MEHLCCSLEMEPKTLNEAAVNIIQRLDPEESATAFIEGLKPVVPLKETEEIVERRQHIHNLVDGKEAPLLARLPLYDCACTTAIVDESPDLTKLREPLSAPF